MKVVINDCFGGFSLSKEATEFMAQQGHQGAREMLGEFENRDKNDSFERIYTDRGLAMPFYGYREVVRHDPLLVLAVETLGEKANGNHARLKVIEIPDGIEYVVEEYDGAEHIAEAHRTWS